MTYTYENKKNYIMRHAVQRSYESVEDLIVCMTPQFQEPDDDDKEYIKELESLLRDLMRMDHNLDLGIFHKDAVKHLKDKADKE